MLLALLAFSAWSVWRPYTYANWISETFPVWIGLAILAISYRRFRFTTVTYAVAWVFALILLTGGHYTYARVPVGDWAQDALGLTRNHFDRVGHVVQGVVPAMFVRELLLRTTPLRKGGWLLALCCCVALAISASYELFEWQYAVLFGGENAADFLGSQGDIWDAQKDMLMALCGAVGSLLLLGPLQDRQMADAIAASSGARAVDDGRGVER